MKAVNPRSSVIETGSASEVVAQGSLIEPNAISYLNDDGKTKEKFQNKDMPTEKQIKASFSSKIQGRKQDPKLSRKLKREIRIETKAADKLARRELLLPETQGYLEANEEVFGEATHKFRQKSILEHVDLQTKQKVLNLDLSQFQSDYSLSYTPNGRHLLFGGSKGHVAFLDTQTLETHCELKLKETVRCVQTLHNDNLFAVSQKKCVFVYDNNGVEIHKMREHQLVHQMDFLKYHMLLATGSEFGDLRFHDISTGQGVASHKTKKGPINVMRQNRANAVMHLGHTNGVVSLWTPNIKEPVLKVLAHKAPIQALDCYKDYVVSAGADGFWRIFDLRKPSEALHQHRFFGQPVTNIDVSHTGLIAMGSGPKVQIYDGKSLFNSSIGAAYEMDGTLKKHPNPYMQENYNGSLISSLKFQPFQDILGVGTNSGLNTMITPGAGIANFDSYEANPFETGKQKNESEVRSLLEKLSADMIVFKHDGLRAGEHKIGNFKRDAATKASKTNNQQAEVRHSGRIIESNKVDPSSFLVDRADDADQDGVLNRDCNKEQKRKEKFLPMDGHTTQKLSVVKDKLASKGFIDKDDHGILALDGRSDDGSDASDKDSEEEFERTGIRWDKSKKKMRGKNKIGKRLKKKEQVKGAELQADKRKRNKMERNNNRKENDSESENDVETEGALSRFKKRRRRQETLADD